MATKIKEIGELSQSVIVEWSIKDIFSFREVDEGYHSPRFSVPGSEWRLQIWPNGRKYDGSEGYISLALIREDSCPLSKTVECSFYLRALDGTIENRRRDFTHVFVDRGQDHGISKFLSRSDLQKREGDLAPSGELVVACNLRVKGSQDYVSRLEKLSDNLRDFYISGKGVDVIFNLEGVQFYTHKSILRPRSPLLTAIFETDMKETGTVNIFDCHPHAFRDLLMYLYSGKFENMTYELFGTHYDIFELYKAADMYQVGDLKSACVQYMIDSLSVHNFFKLATAADHLCETELRKATQEFFIKNFKEIVSCSQWDSFLKENFFTGNELLKNMAQKMN